MSQLLASNTLQNEIHTFTDSAGNVHPLQWLTVGNGINIAFGIKGRGLPPVNLTYFSTPYTPGGALQEARYTVREIDIPVEIFGGSYYQCEAAFREVCGWFDISGGEGVYTVTRTDGTTRQIRCIYKQGLAGDEPVDFGAAGVFKGIIVLSCGDPFWYDPRLAAAQTITVPATTTMGSVVSTTPFNLVNAGSTRAWPIWTIALPFSSVINVPNGGFTYTTTMSAFTVVVSIVNITTGDYFTFYLNGAPTNVTGVATVTYTGTDTIRVVDTRPGYKSIVNAVPAPVPQTLTFQNLFPLVKGNNSIRVDVTLPASRSQGIGTPNTQTFSTGTGSVSMQYTPGFLSW